MANMKKKTECPECKKMYVNLQEHITKTHTGWTMPEITQSKGWVIEYDGVEEGCNFIVRFNGKEIAKNVFIDNGQIDGWFSYNAPKKEHNFWVDIHNKSLVKNSGYDNEVVLKNVKWVQSAKV